MSLTFLGRDYVRRRTPTPLGAPATRPADNFEGLTKYIPVETITLFVAAIAAVDALQATIRLGRWEVYWACAALTPLVLWLIARREHLRTNPAAPFATPWWRMIAATVAFLIWSLSVPGMIEPTPRLAAGVGALFVSTFLTLIEGSIEKP